MIFDALPKRRIIDQLREVFPGRWVYDQQQCVWRHEAGWHVQAFASFAPRYDGDDDTFVTRYRRSDTGEVVGTRGLIYSGTW